jgi:hypothetical protein
MYIPYLKYVSIECFINQAMEYRLPRSIHIKKRGIDLRCTSTPSCVMITILPITSSLFKGKQTRQIAQGNESSKKREITL